MAKKCYLFLIFLLFASTSNAFHIAGGDLTTKWVGGNNFEIHLTLYRDCSNPSGAQYDNTIILGIFDRSTNFLLDTALMDIDQNSIEELALSGSACIIPPSVCIQKADYIRTVTLPSSPQGYYFVWERCCRNSTILNIASPQSAGMAFFEEVPDPALHNSSPVFNSPPLPFLCVSQFFRFGFEATDADGDSLVYELTDPLDGGNTSNTNPNPFSLPPQGTNQIPVSGPYNSIIWDNGYSLNNICGSSMPLVINSHTGVVEGKPDAVGIYAMAVTVYEYRNGVLIGSVRREIEFTVVPCTGNSAPNVSPNILNKEYELYATDTLCFDVTAKDANGDSLFLIHYGEVFENTPLTSITAPYAVSHDTSGIDSIYTTFCWIPSCDQKRDSIYVITYEIQDNGCPLPLTVIGKFRIKVNNVPRVDKPDLVCLKMVDKNSIHLLKGEDNTINARYFKQFTLYRSKNGEPYHQLQIITDPFQNDFLDSTAYNNDQNNYCYYLSGTDNCLNEGTYSDTLCSAQSFNKAKNYIQTVTVDSRNKISMFWENFPDANFAQYYILRKENIPGNAFEKIVEFKNYTSLNWTDQDVNTSEKSYCYKISNEDLCGNISPESDEACTILLKGEAELFLHKLNWSSYINWKGGVGNYIAERAEANLNTPYREKLIVSSIDTIAEDNDLAINGGIFNYRIRAQEGAGGVSAQSLSNEIELKQAPFAYIPNAFTPDRNGKNEDWGASSAFVAKFELWLFNRWGQLIFHANAPEEHWDGNYNGKASPQGVYFYKVRFSGYNHKQVFEKTGSVTLIR